ncbi:hypothetical protein IE077_004269 [Cardiosporidium cionae]|uniref:Uncharacterized protein n=1 Tax=Cardiosporidium cionae TaxID=476202 RepID=A0ABQ7JCS9_9APIC|nr:hypothetical protein IE077_004269 [Cardiosporidium cionae]|eukprot:KAF8821841.1 hypothetical protein IE077_004269 [Cardiosporidium cionae]
MSASGLFSRHISTTKIDSNSPSDSTLPKMRPSVLKPYNVKSASPPALLGLSGNPALLYYLNPVAMVLRPLLAFSVFGEIMKMVLATMSSAHLFK